METRALSLDFHLICPVFIIDVGKRVTKRCKLFPSNGGDQDLYAPKLGTDRFDIDKQSITREFKVRN